MESVLSKKSRLDYLPDRLGIIWLIVFIYIIVTGLFIQMIFLPHIMPSWHSGEGLFRGMDGQQFHRLALQLSERIGQDGWDEWELYPYGQVVSGIAAIWYVLIYPAPWSVLPLNAALYATAAVCFILMLENFIGDRRKSILASLPIIFFPSSLLWNAQFHNENYAVPGVIIILYGWSLVVAKQDEIVAGSGWRELLVIGAGSILLGLVRSYILFGLTCLCLLVWLARSGGLFVKYRLKKVSPSKLTGKMFSLTMSLLVMALCASVFYEPLRSKIIGRADPSLRSDADPLTIKEVQQVKEPSRKWEWEYSPWLPVFIDDQVKEIAFQHNRFSRNWTGKGTTIDNDITFESATDVLAYLPRAFQIAFFSPFPNVWFSSTSAYKVTAVGFRAASSIEMIFAYFSLLGLPYFAWKNRGQAAIWVVIFLCTAMLLLYAVTVPNVGSLYRFRYPYYMPLVCIGFAGWVIMDKQKLMEMLSKPPRSIFYGMAPRRVPPRLKGNATEPVDAKPTPEKR
jgi:putative peptidoglycan lipid II flippase